jgi:hypothetical protein
MLAEIKYRNSQGFELEQVRAYIRDQEDADGAGRF